MTISLRPYLPVDAPVLADIFRASIEELTEEEYDFDQRAAWAGSLDDLASFTGRLSSQLTLIALSDGAVAGFASLKGADEIDMLYVHPRFARQGVASTLVDALEKLVAARGAAAITVDASDTARPFFEKRGYTAEKRNTIVRDDQWLGNTTMRKQLAANDPRKAAAKPRIVR
jgi:putative acetyltransferase